MKKISKVKDETTNKILDEIFNNLRLTDIKPFGEDDYIYDYPSASDKEPPFIRFCKSGSTRRIYTFDVSSETWHYLSLT